MNADLLCNKLIINWVIIFNYYTKLLDINKKIKKINGKSEIFNKYIKKRRKINFNSSLIPNRENNVSISQPNSPNISIIKKPIDFITNNKHNNQYTNNCADFFRFFLLLWLSRKSLRSFLWNFFLKLLAAVCAVSAVIRNIIFTVWTHHKFKFNYFLKFNIKFK